MLVKELTGAFFIVIGLLFFISGTIGLIRLPDIYTRLHALTKADNVGLGFIVLGLAIHATNWLEVVKLLLIWFLVLLASATSSHLIADAAIRRKVKPWTRG